MENRFHYIDKSLISNATGEGILSIRNFDIGDMLLSKTAETITWYDCHGSVGKYVCQLNNLKSLNNQILATQLNETLNSGSDFELKTFIRTDSNNNYLIDGHHKLKAYQNLNANPRVLEITQCYNKYDDELWEETCEILNESLYEWQLKHIFTKCYCQPKYIEKIKNSKTNPFKKFIKQGYNEELWINGNVKTKGNYIDNIPNGIIESFHENGKPKTIALYKDGRVYRYIKSWFHTGELLGEFTKQPDYDNGVQLNYHKTGEIRSRTYFKNGINADGKSSISYYQDGTAQYEATYKDGSVVNRKYYDRKGNLTQENDR